MRLATSTATSIATIAPTRSDHGARLKRSHHDTTISPPTTPPNIPKIATPGATMGTPTMAINTSVAAATPGHKRSGFRGVGSLDWFVISDCLRCADPHDAAKGPSDADAPEPIEHRHDRYQHWNWKKRRDADHLGDSARRTPEKRRGGHPHRKAHAPQVPCDTLGSLKTARTDHAQVAYRGQQPQAAKDEHRNRLGSPTRRDVNAGLQPEQSDRHREEHGADIDPPRPKARRDREQRSRPDIKRQQPRHHRDRR